MDHERMLTTASLLSIGLFISHLAHDIVIGIEAGDLNDLIGGTLISLVWLCGTLLFSGRLLGLIVTLLGGIVSIAIAGLHMSGGVGTRYASEPGHYFFVWTLLVMGLAGSFSLVLSAIGMRKLIKGSTAKEQ